MNKIHVFSITSITTTFKSQITLAFVL
jgi:hypothetical protein